MCLFIQIGAMVSPLNEIAIELLNAAQAIEFRRPLKSSPVIENLLLQYRKQVSFINKDEILYELIQASQRFIKTQLND